MSLVLEVSLHDLWIFIARHRRPVFLNLRGTQGEGKLKSLFVVVGNEGESTCKSSCKCGTSGKSRRQSLAQR